MLAKVSNLRLLVLVVAAFISTTSQLYAQAGHMLFGDLKVDESKMPGGKPMSYDVLLYRENGTLVDRQKISSNGRFRFLDLKNGQYEIVIEMESTVITRQRVDVFSPFQTDFRHDIELAWSSNPGSEKNVKAEAVSVNDFYQRSATNDKRYKKARDSMDQKNYDQALVMLKEIVAEDAKDYQAWTELGTLYFIQQNNKEAENAYLRAATEKPDYILPLINLGRLHLVAKDYDQAIDVLSRAVKTHPESASANFYLGESYLQSKKGSKAVGYLQEALKLDPIGKAEAHLRLASLYHAAGYKNLAADQYEQFLVKRPDYPDKKKLQQYITENKKH